MMYPALSFSLLRCSSSHSSRSPLNVTVLSRLPLLLPSPKLSHRGAGASRAHRVRLRQGRVGRHTPVAAARFVGQSHHPFLQKPLHPLVDKTTANPDRGGNVGDRNPIGHE